MENRQYNFILAACFLAYLGLTACSHDQTTRSTPSSQSTEASPAPASPGKAVEAPSKPRDDRPVIVAFGDSLTAGVATGKSYPDDLQEILDQHGYRYRVENQGISGDTSSDGLARIDNVIDAHPVLVILEFGGNDGLRGIPVASTRNNLRQMIEQLRAAKIPVVLAGITLPPNYGPEYVKPFTSMFPALARQFHLRLLPFLLVHVYQHSAMMQPDGIHPNAAGNQVVAKDVFELIEPLLKKPGPSNK